MGPVSCLHAKNNYKEEVMNARGNGDEGPEDVVGVGGRCGNSVNTAHSPMKPSTKVKKTNKDQQRQ